MRSLSELQSCWSPVLQVLFSRRPSTAVLHRSVAAAFWGFVGVFALIPMYFLDVKHYWRMWSCSCKMAPQGGKGNSNLSTNDCVYRVVVIVTSLLAGSLIAIFPYRIKSLQDVKHYCGSCGIRLARWHRHKRITEVPPSEDRVAGRIGFWKPLECRLSNPSLQNGTALGELRCCFSLDGPLVFLRLSPFCTYSLVQEKRLLGYQTLCAFVAVSPPIIWHMGTGGRGIWGMHWALWRCTIIDTSVPFSAW